MFQVLGEKVEVANTKAITAEPTICANPKKAMPKATLLL
jgi:hypothetical protein